MSEKLSPTMLATLEWLADDSVEHGNPGNIRTLNALRARLLATKVDGRWEITDVGRLELGPIFFAVGPA